MAIQTSLRVRKTFANKLAQCTSTASTYHGRLVMVFVRDTVVFPTDASGMKNYLHSTLNYSSNFGGSSANRDNLLAFTMVMPSSVAELSQVSDLTMLSSNRSITPLKSGRIGSIFVFAPVIQTSTYNMTNIATSTFQDSQTGIIAASVTALSGSLIGLPENMLTNYAANAKNYFNAVHFATDSIGVPSSSACVKISSPDLVAGTPFVLHGFSIKSNLVTQ